MPEKKFKKRKDFLPIAKPSLGKEEISEVIKAIKGGWITTGPKTFEFENAFKKYIGSKHAVALNSCTSALHLAMVALGVGEGDEVILSPFTFVSQANVMIHLGATPVFADIKRDTLNIDPEKIVPKISERTKAIVVTHFAGQPCEREAILKIAALRDIPVIEDAAHALGARYRGEKIGADPATVTCFSFYPIKNITTAEGGMLTCGRDDIAERVRLLSLHGLSKNAWARYTGKGSWEYDVVAPGYKYNLPDILSALGTVQLKKLGPFNKKRKRLAEYYIRSLARIDSITVPRLIDGIDHAWQIFPLMLDGSKTAISRDELIEELKSFNIGTSVHFKPVHMFKFYRETFGFKDGDLPIAEDLFKRILSIPLYPGMDIADCDYVVDALERILSKR